MVVIKPVIDETISDETEFVFDKDPQPANRNVTSIKSASSYRANQSEIKDMQGKIAMLLLPPSALFARWDEYCGTEFVKIVPDLAKDLADIFADSADIVAWFASGAGWFKYLKLLNTLQPVGEMIWKHHIAKTVGEVKLPDGTTVPNPGENWETTYVVPGRFPNQQASTVPTADTINSG